MQVKLNRNFVKTEKIRYQFLEINNGFESMVIDFDWSIENAETQYAESTHHKKAIRKSELWHNSKTRKGAYVDCTEFLKKNF